MRTFGLVVTVMGLVGVVLIAGAQAQDKNKDKAKEVTLKGVVLCAKCALKEAKACQNAIQVKEDGKEVTYYFDDKGAGEEYHEEVCGGDKKEGTVKGTVTVKDGKKYIKPAKVEYTKK
jgi:hypothetical protein